MSTMVGSMKDMSVRSNEDSSMHTIGTIDNITGGVVGGMSMNHMSGISINTMMNDSSDSFFKSSGRAKDLGAHNASWGTQTQTHTTTPIASSQIIHELVQTNGNETRTAAATYPAIASSHGIARKSSKSQLRRPDLAPHSSPFAYSNSNIATINKRSAAASAGAAALGKSLLAANNNTRNSSSNFGNFNNTRRNANANNHTRNSSSSRLNGRETIVPPSSRLNGREPRDAIVPPRRHSTPADCASFYNHTAAATISAMLAMGSAESGSSGGDGNEFVNPLQQQQQCHQQHHQHQQRSQSVSFNVYPFANANNDHNVGTSTTGNSNNAGQQNYQMYPWNYENTFDSMPSSTEGGGGPIGFGENHSAPNNTNP